MAKLIPRDPEEPWYPEPEGVNRHVLNPANYPRAVKDPPSVMPDGDRFKDLLVWGCMHKDPERVRTLIELIWELCHFGGHGLLVRRFPELEWDHEIAMWKSTFRAAPAVQWIQPPCAQWVKAEAYPTPMIGDL